LAGQLANEHGVLARDYARRASVSLEADGDTERALFWLSLSILVEDVVLHRLDPNRIPTIH
jgi:hypothetical protein